MMPWTRVLVAFLIAVLPAVALTVAGMIVGADLPGGDRAVLAGVLVLLEIAWIVVLAAVYSRLLRGESAELVRLAEQGSSTDGASASGGDAQRVIAALAERERQLTSLAEEIATAPITAAPEVVAHHVVRAARNVTGDGTWTLAVLDSSATDLLRAAVYDGSDAGAPAALEDLHRWASVTTGDLPAFTGRPAEGPWGRFMVVPAHAERFRAVLLAPWEGRSAPGRADIALQRVVGRHAGTAIEHAVLYGLVRRQAEEIDRMADVQRDFLRAVSHDLQTPLTSIRALAAEVRATESVSAQASADLDMIEHQADRLRRMVGQLLVVSRLEAGVVTPRQELFNVRAVIERTWTALRAIDRRLVIEQSGAPMLGLADPDRFEQVVWALLENAVRYSPTGTPVQVAIAAGDDSTLKVSVTDQGAGMDAETAARAFEQFYRSPRARELAPDGSGIGLYAARGLMEAMGGSIGIVSHLGRGTTVTLTIPAEAITDRGLEFA